MTSAPDEAGFSLIETLVALTIIAAMAAMLFETISANVRSANMLARRREAALLTQSLLAQASVPGASAQLGDRGRWRQLEWRIDRRRAAESARDSGPALEALQIETIDLATRRRLTMIRTLRVAR